MKITKQEIVREALELIGATATNNQIRNYGKRKYQINLQANDIWATCGSEKERRFNDVTFTELKQIGRDSRKYGSLNRLLTVAKCADSKGKGVGE
tara:strand:+ start:330 stop:614 length:285 start_codon:yes stop_codon:yes gene_type:complete